MIDTGAYSLYIERNEFSEEYEIKTNTISVPSAIASALSDVFAYFKEMDTVPSFMRPDDKLCKLYQKYIDTVHAEMLKIPTDESLNSTDAINIAKLGVVEKEDGTIMLSPFHPLMVAYALQMVKSVDSNEFNKKVMDELSPLYLMPYIYYGNGALKAISSTETEDILTWVKYDKVDDTQHVYGSKATSKLINEKIQNFLDNFKYYFPDADCPIRISAIGLSQSVDLVRGVVNFINTSRKKGKVQRIEIHEYVEDILSDTFFEKLNRQSSRDNILELFEANNFGVKDNDLNEVIRLLTSRVSYYKHTFKERKMDEYSHVTFYKIDSGTNYSPLPANQLRTETALDGLISIPSTSFSGKNYLMGFGTRGLKDNNSPIYMMAKDMNSLYAGMANDGLATYCTDQCTAKRFSFKDSDILQSVYDNSTWITFVYPEVDIDFFYKQKNIYVVHYVEQHSISARLESITVTQHVDQYNNMLFNSLQTFKSIIGTSEDFSRKMINYFNCLNGKWLLDIVNKQELIIREKMSLVATCFVMQHFLKRTDNIIWAPIALDEIVRATGAIGMSQDGLFSKKDLGLEGPLSDDILMMGVRRNVNDEIEVFFYPVEVKVLADDSVGKGEIQVANFYNKALKEVLFKGDSFTRKVYRALLASQFLSNSEKMRANELMSLTDYEMINESRYELLNVKFKISEELPEDLGKAALVVYSDATPKSLSTEWVNDVPVCHIRMMESDCYRIVANPDSHLLQFVEESAISFAPQSTTMTSSATTSQTNATSEQNALSQTKTLLDSEASDESEQEENTSAFIPLSSSASIKLNESMAMVADDVHQSVKIKIGRDRKGSPIFFEANNTTKISHPNMGVVGGMGFGKTQFALSLIAQFAKESVHNVDKRPIGMLIFDYKGDDYSSDDFLKKVDGKCYSFNFPFNPLKLIATDKTKFMNLPAVTADRISDSFAKAYGLGQVQQSTIKQVILETYKDFGITNDPATWNKPQPTMNNVVDKYFEQYDAKDKTYALFDKLRDYMIFTSDNSECVSLFEWLDGVKVIDLTPYPGDTKKVIVSLILDLFYEEMRLLGASKLDGEFRELRAMILVDEAHQFLNKDFNSFRNIISEGRMFGVGMVLSTQNLSDFKSSKQEYSQFILSWVILHLNNITKAEVASIFGSNDPNCQAYVDIVSKAEKFHGICKIGNEVKTIRTLPYYELVKEDKRFVTSDK